MVLGSLLAFWWREGNASEENFMMPNETGRSLRSSARQGCQTERGAQTVSGYDGRSYIAFNRECTAVRSMLRYMTKL